MAWAALVAGVGSAEVVGSDATGVAGVVVGVLATVAPVSELIDGVPFSNSDDT